PRASLPGRRVRPPRPLCMTLDLDWAIVALVLLGHLGLSVVATNMSHSLGLSDRGVSQLRVVLLAAIATLTALIIASAVEGPLASWPWMPRAYAIACLAVALVGLPAVTLVRACRRMPAGISGRATEIDLARPEGKEALIGSGRHAWLLPLPGNAPFRVKSLDVQ